MDVVPDSAAAAPGIAGRLEAARQEFDAQAKRFTEARSRFEATADAFRDSHPRKDLLYYSGYARLQAKLDTMPITEQAKGILMAQRGCGPDEAFDLLRRASQRANVKLSVLAERIVSHYAAGRPASTPPQPRPELLDWLTGRR